MRLLCDRNGLLNLCVCVCVCLWGSRGSDQSCNHLRWRGGNLAECVSAYIFTSLGHMRLNNFVISLKFHSYLGTIEVFFSYRTPLPRYWKRMLPGAEGNRGLMASLVEVERQTEPLSSLISWITPLWFLRTMAAFWWTAEMLPFCFLCNLGQESLPAAIWSWATPVLEKSSGAASG